MEELRKSTYFIKTFLQTINKFPNVNWTDNFSNGQIDSKLWLIEELEKLNLDLGKTFLLAGWYGILASFMFNSKLKFEYIRSFDKNPECHEIAETLNRYYVTNGWRFKATTFDILDITFPLQYNTLRRNGTKCQQEEYPETIINTSCEHMNDSWFNKIPYELICILQSNDFTKINDHTNCVYSIDEMKNKYPLSEIYYEGELQLQKYNRYMLIGKK